ncbi:MAG: NUDIX domain-containing protein [Candidatus Aenigmatarchaeota archaeon]
MAKEYFKLACAVYLILKKDDKVFLLRRFNTGFEDGNYGLISGHIDGGESITHAMIREAKEEAGIVIQPGDLKITHVMHRKCSDMAHERICLFLSASSWTGKIMNMEPDKCDDIGWFPTKKLPENTIAYIKRAIDYSDSNVFFSEDGWE